MSKIIFTISAIVFIMLVTGKKTYQCNKTAAIHCLESQHVIVDRVIPENSLNKSLHNSKCSNPCSGLKMITQEYLKECLNYDIETGFFTWNNRPVHHFLSISSQKSWNTKHSGKQSGKLNDRYIQIGVNGKSYLAHRLAFLYVTGAFPKNVIDHIDGNNKNNSFSNLREVTVSENIQNQRNVSKGNKHCSSLGVSYITKGNKYLSRIVVNKKHIRLGLFNTEEDAYNAYISAKRILHSTCTI
jgi:hypothetical protein